MTWIGRIWERFWAFGKLGIRGSGFGIPALGLGTWIGFLGFWIENLIHIGLAMGFEACLGSCLEERFLDNEEQSRYFLNVLSMDAREAKGRLNRRWKKRKNTLVLAKGK